MYPRPSCVRSLGLTFECVAVSMCPHLYGSRFAYVCIHAYMTLKYVPPKLRLRHLAMMLHSLSRLTSAGQLWETNLVNVILEEIKRRDLHRLDVRTLSYICHSLYLSGHTNVETLDLVVCRGKHGHMQSPLECRLYFFSA